MFWRECPELVEGSVPTTKEAMGGRAWIGGKGSLVVVVEKGDGKGLRAEREKDGAGEGCLRCGYILAE